MSPSVGKWTDKMGDGHAVEYYTVVERRELPLHFPAGMKLILGIPGN